MYQLYGFKRSRSDRPMWLLEELGADYEFFALDFSNQDHRSDYFLGINPAGKVPALKDGDDLFIESGAICQYLADKHDEPKLIPAPGSKARGRHDQWLFFVLTELEQPLWNAGKHRFALPEELRLPAMEKTIAWEFDKAAKLLSQGLGDRMYMVDDRFTVVDLFIAHTLRWAVSFKFSIDYPGLEDFLQRMESRPARQTLHDKAESQIPRAD